MADALFTVNADGSNQGFDAANNQTLTLRLKTLPVSGVTSVLFQVFDPDGFDPELGIAGNPPRASPGAPALTLVGATSGPAVAPAGVDGTVEVEMPAIGSYSWIVRCVVNGGMAALPDGRVVLDRRLVHERMIVIRDENVTRAVVATETTQYDDDGWAGAFEDLRAALPIVVP